MGYNGNCGNISSGVGPFAIDEGLVVPAEPVTRVRIFNTNTRAVLIAEVVLTAVFLLVILGSTAKRAQGGFAGLAIGLCLTLIHLVSIPVSNTSVNPARSTGPALFASTGAIDQLWLFWAAPIVGAVIGALIYQAVLSDE